MGTLAIPNRKYEYIVSGGTTSFGGNPNGRYYDSGLTSSGAPIYYMEGIGAPAYYLIREAGPFGSNYYWALYRFDYPSNQTNYWRTNYGTDIPLTPNLEYPNAYNGAIGTVTVSQYKNNKISIKKQNLGGGKILAKKLNPVYLKIEIASNAIVQNTLQYNGVGSLQNTLIYFEEYMSQNQKNIYNKMNYITKVNFYITLGNVPNGATTMRLGSIYADLYHTAAFEGERRCVLINRPGRSPGLSFGNPLNKLNVIFDNSANENIFNISPFNLADFQGSYQADGRITVSPHLTTPVPYNVNQVTAPLSILNGPVLRNQLDNSPLKSSWGFAIITAQNGFVAKLNYCALEIFGTE